MSFAPTVKELELIMLSEINQAQKDNYHMNSHVKSQKADFIKVENTMVVTRVGQHRERKGCRKVD